MREMYGHRIALTGPHWNREWKSFNHLPLEPHIGTAAKLWGLFSLLRTLLTPPRLLKDFHGEERGRLLRWVAKDFVQLRFAESPRAEARRLSWLCAPSAER